MPKESGNLLPLVGGSSPSPLVLDFLYHDARRVGSFLGQFEVGHLTQLTQLDEVGDQTSESSGRQFAIGAPKVLGGGTETGESAGTSTKEASTRVYDPYWSNARAFLDHLSSNGLIHLDVTTAPMGGFVLISGGLNVIDLGMLKEAWKLPSIKRAALSGAQEAEGGSPGNRADRRRQQRAHGSSAQMSEAESNTQLMLELLSVLPHSIHAIVASGFESVWCGLKEEYLTGSSSDFMLKHGVVIPGKWSILGILDGRPDYSDTGEGDELIADPNSILSNSLLGIVANQLAPIVRLMLGRPIQSYSVTPLLVFRQVVS